MVLQILNFVFKSIKVRFKISLKQEDLKWNRFWRKTTEFKLAIPSSLYSSSSPSLYPSPSSLLITLLFFFSLSLSLPLLSTHHFTLLLIPLFIPPLHLFSLLYSSSSPLSLSLNPSFNLRNPSIQFSPLNPSKNVFFHLPLSSCTIHVPF